MIVSAIKKHQKCKTRIEPEDVEEEPMVTARAQDEQRRAMAKADEEKQQEIFFSTLLFVCDNKRQSKSRKEKANRNQ
jgi:hypothetical protein